MIASILATVAVPQLTSLTWRYQLNGATRVVWGDLHKARLMAIKENRTVQVIFTSTTYSLVRADTAEVVFSRNLVTEYPGITLTAPTTLAFASSGLLTGSTQTVQ